MQTLPVVKSSSIVRFVNKYFCQPFNVASTVKPNTFTSFFVESLPSDMMIELSHTKILFSLIPVPQQPHLCSLKMGINPKSGSFVDAGLQLIKDLLAPNDDNDQVFNNNKFHCTLECSAVSLTDHPVQLVCELSPHAGSITAAVNNSLPTTLFRVCPASRTESTSVVSVPSLLFLRDLFEEAGIRTFMDAHFLCSPDSELLPNHLGITRNVCQNPFGEDTCASSQKQEGPLAKACAMRLKQLDDKEVSKIANKFRMNFSGGVCPFTVLAAEWCSYDGITSGMNTLTSHFMKWTASRQSLCGELKPAFAAEGGFSMPYCPSSSLKAEIAHDWDYRTDYSGTNEYWANDATPFWAMIAFRESLHVYGLPTQTNESCVPDSDLWSSRSQLIFRAFGGVPQHERAEDQMLSSPQQKSKKTADEVQMREYSFASNVELTAFLHRFGYSGLLPYNALDHCFESETLCTNWTELCIGFTERKSKCQSQSKKRGHEIEVEMTGGIYDATEPFYCFLRTGTEDQQELLDNIQKRMIEDEHAHLRKQCLRGLCGSFHSPCVDLISTFRYHGEHLALSDADRKWLAEKGINVLLHTEILSSKQGGHDDSVRKFVLVANTLFQHITTATEIGQLARATAKTLFDLASSPIVPVAVPAASTPVPVAVVASDPPPTIDEMRLPIILQGAAVVLVVPLQHITPWAKRELIALGCAIIQNGNLYGLPK